MLDKEFQEIRTLHLNINRQMILRVYCHTAWTLFSWILQSLLELILIGNHILKLIVCHTIQSEELLDLT